MVEVEEEVELTSSHGECHDNHCSQPSHDGTKLVCGELREDHVEEDNDVPELVQDDHPVAGSCVHV